MGIFNTVPVKKPKHSAFDLSYNNFFTCNMGELIPSLVLPVIPGDRIQYSPTFQVRFAPMVNPVFGDIYAKQECFFVPYRLVWDGWKSFITGVKQADYFNPVPTSVPVLLMRSTGSTADVTVTPNDYGCARLIDFLGSNGFFRYIAGLGIGGTVPAAQVGAVAFNILPFRAYNLVWNEYYRDEFVDSIVSGSGSDPSVFDISSRAEFFNIGTHTLLRRRWAKDYFTTATPQPQYGAVGGQVEAKGTLNSATSGSSVSTFFTIAQFRVANALQKFLERTNIGGGRYNEFILAHFGCMPTDATIQRPEFLGSVTAPVQVNAVANTANFIGVVSQNSYQNAPGALSGTASAVGTKFCFSRSFKEYGVILGLFSVVPRPVYTSGLSRFLRYSTPTDFCFPEYATVGDQKVMRSELVYSYFSDGSDLEFGYQQRYAEYKFHNDEAHGDFILDDMMPTYTFARFLDSAALNSDFLECNPRTNCFVTLTSSNEEDSGSVSTCWVQLRNNIKAIRPLPRYSTPTL